MIKISASISKALEKLDRAEQSQVPFALSVAINETVKQSVNEDVPREIERVFDRPTRWTKKAFRFERSSKRKLYAVVQRKTAQQGRHYLEVQSKGGSRPLTGTERHVRSKALAGQRVRTVAPTSSARLNAAGNWSPAQRKRALDGALNRGATGGGSGKFFTPARGSTLSPGVYERVGRKRKIRKVAHFSANASTYRSRLDIKAPIKARVRLSFATNFRRSLRRALASAK